MTRLPVFFGLLICNFGLFMTTSCTNSNEGVPVAGVSSFDLSVENVEELTVKAEGGSSEAALKLYRFYDFVKLERERALYWIERAANLNDPSAQFVLGKFYLDDSTIRNIEKAKAWLSRAKENGSLEAAEVLERVECQSGYVVPKKIEMNGCDYILTNIRIK